MRPKCPKCQSPIVSLHGKHKRLQKYICTTCNHQWTPGLPKRRVASGKPCYECGRTMRKDGFNRNGSQRYHCPFCKIRRSDTTLKEEIPYYWHNTTIITS